MYRRGFFERSDRSPSVRRVWIEIRSLHTSPARLTVTLRAEGVDRNIIASMRCFAVSVTLRAEGVDRNSARCYGVRRKTSSPSVRRVWIEIFGLTESILCDIVTLRAEGVDRNDSKREAARWQELSPSVRRVWIEMHMGLRARHTRQVTLRAEGVDRNIHAERVADMRNRHPPCGGCG